MIFDDFLIKFWSKYRIGVDFSKKLMIFQILFDIWFFFIKKIKKNEKNEKNWKKWILRNFENFDQILKNVEKCSKFD